MKRPLNEEIVTTNNNSLLLLPYELIDSILDYETGPFDRFASLARLYQINRASYRLWGESIVCIAVHQLLAQCLVHNAEVSFASNEVRLWTRLARFALSRDCYRSAMDAYFDANHGVNNRAMLHILSRALDHIHSSEYNDLGFRVHNIINHSERMPHTQQRLLAYHCASMFHHRKTPRVTISHVSPFSSLCHLYVYEDDDCGDDAAAAYRVTLTNDVTVSLDLRRLKPLVVPLSYHGQPLYTIENAPRAEIMTYFMVSRDSYAKSGALAPPLHIESLLKRIKESDAFRACLCECHRILRPPKQSKRARNTPIKK